MKKTNNMGIFKHNAIIVTTSIGAKDEFLQTFDKAVELFGNLVTPMIRSQYNGFNTFFVTPDGSKEFWYESDEFDIKRQQLYDFVESFRYEDGSTSIVIIDVGYGEMEVGIDMTKIEQSNYKQKLNETNIRQSI